jgi:hypothetical protein
MVARGFPARFAPAVSKAPSVSDLRVNRKNSTREAGVQLHV